MAINVSVQYNGGFLSDIILLSIQCYYHRFFSPIIDYENKWADFFKTNGYSNLPDGTALNNFIIPSIYKSSDDGRNLRHIICRERCLL